MNQRIVLLDTVGSLALWSRRDQWHEAAFRAYQTLCADRALFVSTSYIFLECGNAASRWPFRAELLDLRVRLERTGRLIHPTQDDWQLAWKAYEKRENASAGIVDQVSIILMRRLGLTEVFGNDQHFQAAGFQTLF